MRCVWALRTRTKRELNVLCLEGRAAAVCGDLARKRGDVLHEIVSHVLQDLQSGRRGSP